MNKTALEQERKFKLKMEDIVAAFRVFNQMVATVTDEDLEWMRETCERAHGMSIFLTIPFELEATEARLQEQLQLLQFVRNARGFYREMETKHAANQAAQNDLATVRAFLDVAVTAHQAG